MKTFINENLLTKDGMKINPRKCRKDWFDNNGFSSQYNQIVTSTNWCSSFSERCYSILNNITENPTCVDCGSDTKFRNKTGYSVRCVTCSSKHESTKLQHPDVVNRRNVSIKESYQNFNFTDRNIKSRETTLINHGVSHHMKLDVYRDFYSKLQRKEIPVNLLDTNKTIANIQDEIGFSESHIRQEYHKNDIEWRSVKSKYEQELVSFLDSLGIENIVTGTRSVITPLELDIYLPDYDLAIEFNGLYYHSDIFKEKKYHLLKTELCEDNNIQLLHIFEHEWNTKKDIWKALISAKLGKSDRIYARKCKLALVENNESNTFLNENHLQGSINSSLSHGLYHDNELVALMTFGKSRFTSGEYELYRYCNRKDITVVGGFSKLLKNSNITNVISYANRRWCGKRNVYESNDFELINTTPPNYFYFDNKHNFYSRNKFMKHKLSTQLSQFDSNLTEYQNMINNGYNRIFDCGNYKYIYR